MIIEVDPKPQSPSPLLATSLSNNSLLSDNNDEEESNGFDTPQEPNDIVLNTNFDFHTPAFSSRSLQNSSSGSNNRKAVTDHWLDNGERVVVVDPNVSEDEEEEQTIPQMSPSTSVSSPPSKKRHSSPNLSTVGGLLAAKRLRFDDEQQPTVGSSSSKSSLNDSGFDDSLHNSINLSERTDNVSLPAPVLQLLISAAGGNLNNGSLAEMLTGDPSLLKAINDAVNPSKPSTLQLLPEESEPQSRWSPNDSGRFNNNKAEDKPDWLKQLFSKEPSATTRFPRVAPKRRRNTTGDYLKSSESVVNQLKTLKGQKLAELEELEQFASAFKRQRIKYGFTQGDVGVALGRRYGTDFSQTTISRFEALNLSFKNMCKLRPLMEEWMNEAEAAIEKGATVTEVVEAVDSVKPPKPIQHREPPKIEKPQPPPPPPKPPVVIQQPIVFEPKRSSPSPIAGSSLTALQMANVLPTLKRRRKRTNLDAHQKDTLDAYFHLNNRPDHQKMADIGAELDLDPDVVRVWFCNRRQKTRKVI